MRPPEFTGGNVVLPAVERRVARASMRPPEFTGGNIAHAGGRWADDRVASMRPPEFTGGNSSVTMQMVAATIRSLQ